MLCPVVFLGRPLHSAGGATQREKSVTDGLGKSGTESTFFLICLPG